MPHAPEQSLFELFAVFVAAKVGGELLGRIKLPAVLEILAGVVLGPFALGWVNPGDVTPSVAELGAVFVLFHAGIGITARVLEDLGVLSTYNAKIILGAAVFDGPAMGLASACR